VMGRDNQFRTGPVEAVLTAAQLSALYGLPLTVERTPSGRMVVGPGA
jgi:iron complex transport system ATP-binding protein